MSVIPNVVDVLNAAKKTRMPKQSSIQHLENAAFAFKEALKTDICQKLEHFTQVDVRFQRLGSYLGIPGDVLLYGHRENGDWQRRSDLGIKEMPFRTLQQEFYDQGWYLIEETDPSISRMFIFKLYASEPKNHPYYNKPGLWHYHNFLYAKKLAPLAVPKTETKVTKEQKSDVPKKEKVPACWYVCDTKDPEPRGPGLRRFKIVLDFASEGVLSKPEIDLKKNRVDGYTLLEAAKKAFLIIAEARTEEARKQMYPGDYESILKFFDESFALKETGYKSKKEQFWFHGRRDLLDKPLYTRGLYGKGKEITYSYDIFEIKDEDEEDKKVKALGEFKVEEKVENHHELIKDVKSSPKAFVQKFEDEADEQDPGKVTNLEAFLESQGFIKMV